MDEINKRMSANRKEKKLKLEPWVTLTLKDQEDYMEPAKGTEQEWLGRKEKPVW